MAAFPSTLPAPLASGYSIDPQSQVIRTEMETGSPRVRRRSAVRIDHVEIGWVFTDAQMTSFRTWFDSSAGAAGGAGWFNLTIKSGDGSSVVCEARFVEPWSASLSAGFGIWRVGAKVEVRYA